MYRINIITRIIQVFIVLFVIANAFDGVEIWTIYFAPQIPIPPGTAIKTGAVAKLFFVALIIGCAQFVTMLIKGKKFQILSLYGAVAGLIFSLRIPFFAVIPDLIGGVIGGLASTEYIASVFGYIQVGLAILLLVLQISRYVLLRKKAMDKVS